MKKLTNQNIKYFKSIMQDLIYRQYSLENVYKYKVDIKTTFNSVYETNKIVIIITYQLRKTSEGCYHETYTFIENWLSTFENHYLQNDGCVEHRAITEYNLEKINTIVDNVKVILERTPPELAADIYRHGIYLTGGSSQVKFLADRIHKGTGLRVNVSENPLTSVALGLAKIINEKNYKSVAYAIEGMSK